MSDSLPTMTAAPQQITVAGKPYTIAPLTFRDLADLEQWVNRQMPDPKAVAREMIEGLPDALAEKIMMEAFRVALRGPVKLNSPEAAQILNGPGGICQAFFLSLKKYQPNLMIQDVERLIEEMSPDEIDAMENSIYGEDTAGPKSGAATANGATPTSRRRGAKSSTR
jgi:hypothetical protein